MGQKCNFYKCPNRATRYARVPSWSIKLDFDAVPVTEKIHAYCANHVDAVEVRYEEKLWAREGL